MVIGERPIQRVLHVGDIKRVSNGRGASVMRSGCSTGVSGSRVQRGKAFTDREFCQLGDVAQLEFFHDVLAMRLDGFGA